MANKWPPELFWPATRAWWSEELAEAFLAIYPKPPNKDQTWTELFVIFEQDFVLTGVMYAWALPDASGAVCEMHRLDPTKVLLYPDGSVRYDTNLGGPFDKDYEMTIPAGRVLRPKPPDPEPSIIVTVSPEPENLR